MISCSLRQFLWNSSNGVKGVEIKFYSYSLGLLCWLHVTRKWLRFAPYPSGLLHWHWGNHMIAPVSVKQPWRIWVNATRTDNIATTKQSTTKPCTYCMEYTAHLFCSELSILLMANNNFDSPGWDSQVWEEFSGFFLISRFFAGMEILKSEKNMQSFRVLRIITKNFPGHFWSQTSDWSSPLVWN